MVVNKPTLYRDCSIGGKGPDVDKRLRGWSTGLIMLIVYIAALGLGIVNRANIGRQGVIFNRGMAFGLLAYAPSWSLAVVSALAMAALVAAWWRWREYQTVLAIIFAGALANWTERLLWGGIVDFWRVPGYPFVFNLGDIAIRLGMIALVIQYWLLTRSVRTRSKGLAEVGREFKRR